jgi:hypothetical protein
MNVSDVALALPLCVLAPAVEAGAAPVPTHSVPVRVYDTAGLDGRLESAALAVASEAVAAAAIDVAWSRCGSRRPEPACHGSAADALMLRIVRSKATDPTDEPVSLGFVYVDSSTRSAVLATIYFDRVARLAKKAGANLAVLLGHAIAHELGHLLLASTSHSADGLMRPVWLPGELRRINRADWQFSPQDVAEIRSRLESRRGWAN